jgi:hypothetical protein
MWLAWVSPQVRGREWRTFECPVCEISLQNQNAQDRTIRSARRHAVAGRPIVAAQRRRIVALRAKGFNTAQAEALPATYEQTQALFEDDLRAIEVKSEK